MDDAAERDAWETPPERRWRLPVYAVAAVAAGVVLLVVVAGGDGTQPPDEDLVVERRTPQPTEGPESEAAPARRGRPRDRDLEALAVRQPLPPPEPAPLRPVEGTWSEHGEAPVSQPSEPQALWTGRVLVVLGSGAGPHPQEGGGQRLAVWDAAADTWSALEAPIPSRSGATLTWTGREVLVVGGLDAGRQRPDGAAWDPVTGRWRVLPDAPGGIVAAVWTGRALQAWLRVDGMVRVHAHDPGGDGWQPVESAALHGLVPSGAGFARGRPLVWGRAVGSGEPALLVGHNSVAVGAPPGFDPRTVSVAGEGLLALGVSGGRSVGAAYVLGRGWEPLPTMYGRAATAERPITSVWTGTRLVFSDGTTVVAYDPSSGRWEDYGVPSGLRAGVGASALAWTGDRLLLWAGEPGRQTGALYAWRPAG